MCGIPRPCRSTGNEPPAISDGAKFGLFIHYGLYSLPGHSERVQFREKIPVAKYAELQRQFTAIPTGGIGVIPMRPTTMNGPRGGRFYVPAR